MRNIAGPARGIEIAGLPTAAAAPSTPPASIRPRRQPLEGRPSRIAPAEPSVTVRAGGLEKRAQPIELSFVLGDKLLAELAQAVEVVGAGIVQRSARAVERCLESQVPRAE
jgi:hypothetical protein